MNKDNKKSLQVIDEPSFKEIKVGIDRYIKISEKSKSSDFKIIGERVNNGEAKISHYAIENDIGFFYYLIIK